MRTYSQEIIQFARDYGYKSANLNYLDQLLAQLLPTNDFNQVKVPPFFPISDHEVKDYLDRCAPMWRIYWDMFVSGFKQNVPPDVQNLCLENLQNYLITSFAEGNFFVESTPSLHSKRLMVRSTGKEDAVDMANPGGNGSFPAENNAKDITAALGHVVVSYFDKKSIRQRLLAGQDITIDPFLPVLLQELIEENEQSIPTSGVIYTKNGKSMLHFAWGHGELVVNSKGPVDSCFVSSHGVVYPELHSKPLRIRAEWNAENKALELKTVKNSRLLANSFSLDEATVYNLHEVNVFLETKYGMPVDTEFVYEPNTHTINIVQTRPIPESQLKTLPTALNPELVSSCQFALQGTTITPYVQHAICITNPTDLFIGDSINAALDWHLHHGLIKAVVVKNPAPSTSHGMTFRSV